MYVAITRAKKELYISRAHERYSFGNYSANPKSRFLKEIPDEYLHIESHRGSAESIFGGGSGSFSSLSGAFGKPPFEGGIQGGSALGKKESSSLSTKNKSSDFSL